MNYSLTFSAQPEAGKPVLKVPVDEAASENKQATRFSSILASELAAKSDVAGQKPTIDASAQKPSADFPTLLQDLSDLSESLQLLTRNSATPESEDPSGFLKRIRSTVAQVAEAFSGTPIGDRAQQLAVRLEDMSAWVAIPNAQISDFVAQNDLPDILNNFVAAAGEALSDTASTGRRETPTVFTPNTVVATSENDGPSAPKLEDAAVLVAEPAEPTNTAIPGNAASQIAARPRPDQTTVQDLDLRPQTNPQVQASVTGAQNKPAGDASAIQQVLTGAAATKLPGNELPEPATMPLRNTTEPAFLREDTPESRSPTSDLGSLTSATKKAAQVKAGASVSAGLGSEAIRAGISELGSQMQNTVVQQSVATDARVTGTPDASVIQQNSANAAPAFTFARSVASQIRGVSLEEGRTRIELSPRGLGDVEIDMARDDSGKLRIVLRADNPAVLTAFRNDRDLILNVLRESGVTVEASDLDFEAFNHGSGSNHYVEAEAYSTSAQLDEGSAPAAPTAASIRPDLIASNKLNILT